MLSLPHLRTTRTFSLSGYVQLAWSMSGAAYAFFLPFVFSSLLGLPNDLYYAIYFAGIVAFLALYTASTGLDAVGLFSRNWRWSVGLGVLVAAFLVFGVLQREDPTPQPNGLYFIFTIGWRGALYGVVDALILTAFPTAVAYALFGSRVDTVSRKAGFGALALILSLTITATYHLGYEQFREDGVSGPETGNAIISVPAMLTTNPLGSVVAHASMHIAADIHAYETGLYLPPQTFIEAEPGAYPAELQLTGDDDGSKVKLALGGTLIVALASNPSTGYAWTAPSELPDMLSQEGESRFIPAGSTGPVPGAGGTEVFTFKADGKGEDTLEFVYKRGFEDGAPGETFSVQVFVR